jgi:predicted nucleic acid-binding protein
MNRILLDTYAWIEYFRGSEEGRIVKELIESKSEILTPTLVIAELSDKYRRTGKGNEWEKDRMRVVKLRSAVVALNASSANEAGRTKLQMRSQYEDFPLADGMILAIAREREASILTGDRHLRNLPESMNLNNP